MHSKQATNQYNRYVSRGVYASDVLVQRLDGSVAAVVCDGEHQHVSVRPVDGPAGQRYHRTVFSHVYIKVTFIYAWCRADLLICSWQYRPSASSCRRSDVILMGAGKGSLQRQMAVYGHTHQLFQTYESLNITRPPRCQVKSNHAANKAHV